MFYATQNQFGLTFDQVRKLYPNKSFPADGRIDTPEVSSYVPSTTPDYDPATHAVRETAPVDGVQQWEVYPLPAEEVAANQAAARVAKWETIKAERDRRKALGVKVGAHWFHSDDPSRIQQLGLARKADRLEASGGSMDTPFSGPGPGGILAWKTIGGSFVPMTPTLAQQISEAIEALDLGVFAAAEGHRMAMEASENPESYDFSGGWPATIEDTP
jgi:hypothetical protein